MEGHRGDLDVQASSSVVEKFGELLLSTNVVVGGGVGVEENLARNNGGVW